MQLLPAGLVAPYLVAVVAQGAMRWSIPLAVCLPIVLSPWLVAAEDRLSRLLASISAAIVAVKVIDVWLDAKLRSAPTWQEYLAFLANPFVHVRRCLSLERHPPWRESLRRLVMGSFGCAIGIGLLVGLFSLDWKGWPFLVEHVSKVVAFMLAIISGLTASAALWRLFGGRAREYMDQPFSAHTPAEFWRRYNRNMQQFLWQDVFKPAGGLRAPIRTTLFVFALSALMHELIFSVAIGRVQGYQTAFFSVQGVAAALTARVKAKGWTTIPWTAGTLAFNLTSSVLFFASINEVVPFYARALPKWLRGW